VTTASARIKDLTGWLGAHSVIEAVGTQESMMQAIRATRPGGHVGYVGVAHGVELPGQELFFPTCTAGPPRCAASCPS
jgi:threonine dehydrogenase-like Zn-dependent dehydrogenase